MKSKVILITIFILVVLTTVIVHRFVAMPTNIFPMPYIVQEVLIKDRLPAKLDPQVIILGDGAALKLKGIIPDLVKKTSKKISGQIEIYNWAQNYDGIHRSIAKLKSLKKFPPLIIYMGGGSEFFEQKFNLLKRATILENFNKYEDEKWQSLMITMPWLSRLIYHNPRFVHLSGEKLEDKHEYSAKDKQLALEISLKLFKLELLEMVSLIKANNSRLIFITTPINLEYPPNQVCENTTNSKITSSQKNIKDLIDKKKYKDAYINLKPLMEESLANAQTYHLKGITELKLGLLEDAKNTLLFAKAFDCDLKKITPMHNAIIKDVAVSENIKLIDFHNLIVNNLGKNALFITPETPQSIYYLELEKLLYTDIVTTLRL